MRTGLSGCQLGPPRWSLEFGGRGFAAGAAGAGALAGTGAVSQMVGGGWS